MNVKKFGLLVSLIGIIACAGVFLVLFAVGICTDIITLDFFMQVTWVLMYGFAGCMLLGFVILMLDIFSKTKSNMDDYISFPTDSCDHGVM